MIVEQRRAGGSGVRVSRRGHIHSRPLPDDSDRYFLRMLVQAQIKIGNEALGHREMKDISEVLRRKVFDGCCENPPVVTEVSKSNVTRKTKQTTHSPSGMTVINMKRFVASLGRPFCRRAANGTSATLLFKKFVVLFKRYAVLAFNPPCSLSSTSFGSLTNLSIPFKVPTPSFPVASRPIFDVILVSLFQNGLPVFKVVSSTGFLVVSVHASSVLTLVS